MEGQGSLMFLVYLAIVVYVLFLATRFVNAHERIASSVNSIARSKAGAKHEEGP